MGFIGEYRKTERIHDLVIGLFVNRYECEGTISRETHHAETPSESISDGCLGL
jgi:hypothetical protein